jgi:hypothetical protein
MTDERFRVFCNRVIAAWIVLCLAMAFAWVLQ